MLSISSRGNAAQAADYYAHLAADDDYYANGEGAGRWFGQGADALDLAGQPVKPDDFKNLLHGYSPAGEPLANNAGPAHRAGWDFTFSAPKSLSVLQAVSDEATRAAIQEAHKKAIEAALSKIESDLMTARQGKGGKGNSQGVRLVAGVFDHATSRELDPQLHSHAFIMNLVQDADGNWRSADPQCAFKWKMALGAYYRAELAHRLHQLGLKTERDGRSFAVSGVPAEVCKEFSRRSAQIEARAKELAAAGITGTKAKEIAALETRRAKESLPGDGLQVDWLARAEGAGFGPEQARALLSARHYDENKLADLYREEFGVELDLADAGEVATYGDELLTRDPKADIWWTPDPKPLDIDAVLGNLTAMDSTFKLEDVYRVIGEELQIRGGGAAAVEQAAEQILQDGRILRLAPDRWTTWEMLRREAEAVRLARGLAAAGGFAVSSENRAAVLGSEKYSTLNESQQAALDHVTASGRFAMIQGDAGTGKSHIMGAARLMWEAEGCSVLGCALAGKAAAELEAGAGIKSQTLDSLLIALDAGRVELSGKSVIVLDEAAMVGSVHYHRLLTHADAAGAKIVAVGDDKQLAAVAAGGIYRRLRADVGWARMDQTVRHKLAWVREAAELAAAGDFVGALNEYERNGRLHTPDDRQTAMQQIASAYMNCAESYEQKLLMAGTRSEVGQLNDIAFDIAKARGELINEATITNADREEIRVAEGARILLGRNDKRSVALFGADAEGVKNGQLGTVSSISYDSRGELWITAQLDSGGTARFSPTLRERDGGYRNIALGYAVTTHKSQGATVNEAFVLAGGSMASAELSYVQMSRSRYDTHIYIDRQSMDSTPPTPGMVELAERVAEEGCLQLPEEVFDSFGACRQWLNETTYSLDPAQVPWLDEVRQQVARMSASQRKDTALEYANEAMVAEALGDADHGVKVGPVDLADEGRREQSQPIRSRTFSGPAPEIRVDGERLAQRIAGQLRQARERSLMREATREIREQSGLYRLAPLFDERMRAQLDDATRAEARERVAVQVQVEPAEVEQILTGCGLTGELAEVHAASSDLIERWQAQHEPMPQIHIEQPAVQPEQTPAQPLETRLHRALLISLRDQYVSHRLQGVSADSDRALALARTEAEAEAADIHVKPAQLAALLAVRDPAKIPGPLQPVFEAFRDEIELHQAELQQKAEVAQAGEVIEQVAEAAAAPADPWATVERILSGQHKTPAPQIDIDGILSGRVKPTPRPQQQTPGRDREQELELE